MIGVFDSGIGGLTVVSHLRLLMPKTPIFYVADTQFSPYGNLDGSTLKDRVKIISSWLIEQSASVIVVACNTATAIAIDQLREEFDVPIVGVEPGVKPAALNSDSLKVGILATENTVASQRYQNLIERFVPNVEVISQGCPGLADAIEYKLEKAVPLVETYVRPLLERGVDHIVLGCTHYPLVKEQIQMLAGPGVTVIDTGYAVAQEVIRQFQAASNFTSVDRPEESIHVFTTADVAQVQRIVAQYDDFSFLSNRSIKPLSL